MAARRLDGLAVYMPPRHAKSTTCSQFFPAYYLGAFPEHRVILGAYNSGFAASWGRKVRDVIEGCGANGGGPVFDYRLRGDSSAAAEWELAGSGGGMLTSGIGGGITGRGADLLILDDPIKDAKEAFSETVRQGHKDWYDSTADTRLEPGAVELLVMTRWHPDDLSSHVVASWRLSGKRFEELRLPALAEENDPLGRAEGEALWPERYPVAALEAKRAKGAYWWSALYQQRPTPREGAIFLDKWFRWYGRHGTGYLLKPPGGADIIIPVEQVIDRFLTVDTAASVPALKKPDPDYTVVSAWGLVRGRLLWLGCERKRIEVPDIPKLVAAEYRKHRATKAYVESGGTQKGVPQLLRRHPDPHMNVVELQTSGQGDKLARAHSFLSMAEAGNVWLPAGDPTFPTDAVRFELLAFTGAKSGHDDIWDTAGMAGRVAAGKYGQPKMAPQLVGT